MGTYNSSHEGRWPHITKKDLPHNGKSRGDISIKKLSDEVRDRVNEAINAWEPTENPEKKATWWDAYNGGSTYKPQ